MSARSLVSPPLIAHRGAPDRAPENTQAGFVAAAEAGARFVEFDVRLSADGELVLMHDPTLERTTDGSGLVAEHTRAQLAALDAGSWFAEEFTGEPVPALDEILALLEELDLSADIELKAESSAAALATAQAVVDLVKRHASTADAEPWPAALMLSSSQPEALELLAEQLPELPRALVVALPDADTAKLARRLGCAAMFVDHRALRPALIAEARSLKLALGAYTVNDPDRAEQLWDAGVRSIFSDIPDLPAVSKDLDPDDAESSSEPSSPQPQPPAG
jgi:glycerophosphoryl diester phosphodiesterase